MDTIIFFAYERFLIIKVKFVVRGDKILSFSQSKMTG